MLSKSDSYFGLEEWLYQLLNWAFESADEALAPCSHLLDAAMKERKELKSQ